MPRRMPRGQIPDGGFDVPKGGPRETLRARSTRVARLSLGTWQRHPCDARITILLTAAVPHRRSLQ
jgi:hypothetical protein